MGEYSERSCKGSEWKKQFPHSSNQEIRDFLNTFVDAFMINSDHFLKFQPTDRVHEIYRAIYPSIHTPDALEYNFLDKALQNRYGFSLSNGNLSDLTLGQLFSAIKNA
jgi:hypothetical protein